MTPPESSRRDGSCRIAVRQWWSSDWLHSLNRTVLHASPKWHGVSVADPIYGKFAGKTNAISRFRKTAIRIRDRPIGPCRKRSFDVIEVRFTVRDLSAPGCTGRSTSGDFAAGTPE